MQLVTSPLIDDEPRDTSWSAGALIELEQSTGADSLSGNASMHSLRLEWEPASRRESVLTNWRALERRVQNQTIACSSLWTQTWLAHFGGLVPHRFAQFWRGETLVGLALVTEGVEQFNGPFRIRTVHLGTAGEPEQDSVCIERNGLLCEPHEFQSALQLLIRTLASEGWWDNLCLDGMLLNVSLLPDVASIAQTAGQATWSTRPVINHYCDLQRFRDAGGDLVTQFGVATRKTLRRNLRDFAPLTVDWCESSSQIDECFDELVALHQARWQAIGQPGVYSSARFTNFHRDWLHRSVSLGLSTVVRVRCHMVGSGTPLTIGCAHLLLEGREALVYQGGHIESSSGLSPGVLVDFKVLEAALQRGYHAYDFLGGDSLHKRRLTTNHRELYWSSLVRPRWKHRVANGLRSLKATASTWLQRAREASTAPAGRPAATPSPSDRTEQIAPPTETLA